MANLRPPDGRVFVSLDKRHKKQYDVTIQSVGRGSDFVVGQRVCVMGTIEKVDIQNAEVYSVNEAHIAFIYE
jgi:hypothetical protein